MYWASAQQLASHLPPKWSCCLSANQAPFLCPMDIKYKYVRGYLLLRRHPSWRQEPSQMKHAYSDVGPSKMYPRSGEHAPETGNPDPWAVCQNSPLGHVCFTSGGSGGCEGMVLLLWQFWWVFRVFVVVSAVLGWGWDSKRQAVFLCRAGGNPPLPPAYQRPLGAFFTPSKQKTVGILASVNFVVRCRRVV